jgi:hypothetical protein
MQKTIERLIEEAIIKFNLPEEVIIAIFESPYKCARKRIGEAIKGEPDTFVNIRFKNLGLLYADPNKIKAIEYARRNRSNKDNSE